MFSPFKLIGMVFLFAATGIGSSVWAHHSFAMFDSKVLAEVAGTVKDVQWANPHVYIDVVGTSDYPGTWTFEAGGPSMLEHDGISKDTFRPGDKVVIRMHPLRNGATGGLLISVKTESGKLYTVTSASAIPENEKPVNK
jgi:hypothetical protein